MVFAKLGRRLFAIVFLAVASLLEAGGSPGTAKGLRTTDGERRCAVQSMLLRRARFDPLGRRTDAAR